MVHEEGWLGRWGVFPAAGEAQAPRSIDAKQIDGIEQEEGRKKRRNKERASWLQRMAQPDDSHELTTL